MENLSIAEVARIKGGDLTVHTYGAETERVCSVLEERTNASATDRVVSLIGAGCVPRKKVGGQKMLGQG